LHVPYADGFAIIMLTVLVTAATFPVTRKQVCYFRIVFVSLVLNSLI
jgi:membrane protein insertase Oxa1/YidC/SpoIIIJ